VILANNTSGQIILDTKYQGTNVVQFTFK